MRSQIGAKDKMQVYQHDRFSVNYASLVWIIFQKESRSEGTKKHPKQRVLNQKYVLTSYACRQGVW